MKLWQEVKIFAASLVITCILTLLCGVVVVVLNHYVDVPEVVNDAGMAVEAWIWGEVTP